jgi:SNF2 family DNA or RNA helicase
MNKKLDRSDIHPYQRKAIDFICKTKRCSLWLDMGLGKTVSTLTALSDLLSACIIRRVLVIAPLRVANSVWKQEAEKWTHLSHLRISVATGPVERRREALGNDANIYVINRENLVWLIGLCSEKKIWPYDAVVIDEGSSFKNPSAKRFKRFKKISQSVDFMVILTGTPSPNGLMDLWSQSYLMDGGRALGRTITSYRQRFFTPDQWGHNWTPKAGADKEIKRLLKPMVMSMCAKDYIDVPERIDLVEWVGLDKDVLKRYMEFEEKLFMSVEGQEIEAMSAAVLANKLLQFANGAMYGDDGKWAELHKLKLDCLGEIVEENGSENILVAYNYRHDLERIRKRFSNCVMLDKNPDTIQKWNDGGIKILVAHPASCGHGLNLQDEGSLVVWFGLTWNLEHYLQMNARLHRQGQTKPVRVVRIAARGTIDERVLKVIGKKDAVQTDLLEALKG